MRNVAVPILVALVLPVPLYAQTVQNTVVELSCTVQAAPPRIAFTWPANPTSTGYFVYRRPVGSANWVGLVSVPAAAVGWTDSTVSLGQPYEYRIDKFGTPIGRGIATCGIGVPAVHSRGALVVVVANTHATYLAPELARLAQDLVGDGWRVIRHDVAPSASVPDIKALIVADYQADPSHVSAVFLLGHVPVPYSGSTAWDGHADHAGAWPSDGFYGDMDGTWTDTSVNSTGASRAENRNVPGDGKFDPSTFPSDVELMVGRVDLANMSSFPLSERDLLRAYLDKDHAFRHKLISAQERAVIDDNFGFSGGEAFAASGWRNFAPMFGAANSVAADYFATLNTTTGPGYLWSYGCGPGTYFSAGGVGSSYDFVTTTNRNMFTMLFGSYHGDWDTPDNMLRAPLCSGWTLTCAWAGRPAWTFSSMALGEPIGFATRWSQNDPSPMNGFGARGCHMALMGDPSLRMHVVAPPSELAGVPSGRTMVLRWEGSIEPVLGYHVYRADPATGGFTLLNAVPTGEPLYVDDTPRAGSNTYMVRALATQASSSGTYANLSQGTFGTFTSTVGLASTGVATSLQLRAVGPNPVMGAAEVVFELPRVGHARLSVFDASGRQVRTLQDGPLTAGTHRRRWDGRDASNAVVAPGVYLVRLSAGTQARSVKLAMVR